MTTDWKKSYMDLSKKYNEMSDELDSAMSILASVLECGSMDLGCIFDMEKNHEGTVERAIELKDEIDCMNFANFVMAVKDVSIDEVKDELEELGLENEIESLEDMIIDDNYCAWGGIANYGSYDGEYTERNQEFQSIFADYIGTGDYNQFISETKRVFGL